MDLIVFNLVQRTPHQPNNRVANRSTTHNETKVRGVAILLAPLRSTAPANNFSYHGDSKRT